MSVDTFGRDKKVEYYATHYSKEQMATMVQSQELTIDVATMAAAMIDRIAATANKPPFIDVAHEINPYLPRPAGTQMAQAAPAPAPDPTEAPAPAPEPTALAAEGGLMNLNHGGYHAGLAGLESNIPEMAGGGIVAFATGGDNRYGDGLPGGPMPQQPLNIPAQQTPEGIMAAQSNMDRLAGVDPNFFANQQASLAQDRKDLSAEKEKALGEGLMLFGVGLMGAREGQVWARASESAQQALLQVAGAHNEIKKQEAEMKNASRALNVAEHQFKLGKSAAASATIAANLQKIEDAKNAQIAAKNVENQGYFKGFLELALVDKKGLIDKAIAEIKATSERSTESERFVAHLKNLRANGTPEQTSQFLADWNQAKGNGINQKDIFSLMSKDTFGLKSRADIKKQAETAGAIANELSTPQAPVKAPIPGKAPVGNNQVDLNNPLIPRK